jgi:hypothetical protein
VSGPLDPKAEERLQPNFHSDFLDLLVKEGFRLEKRGMFNINYPYAFWGVLVKKDIWWP